MSSSSGFRGFLLLFFASGSLGYAEPSWSAELGLGGVVVPGTWAPLRVEAPTIPGPWTLQAGPVVWDFPGPGVFERPVFLADGLPTLNLRRTDGGMIREERVLPVASRAFPGNVILSHGLEASTKRALAALLLPREPVLVVDEPPSRWPVSFFAYDMITALVVKDPGPVLSPVQVQALKAWVASGGRWAVIDRASPSLVDEVGLGEGGAPVSDPAELNLDPYGTNPRWGTDFGPPAKDLPAGSGPGTPGTLGFLGAWTLLVLALSRFSRPTKAAWGVVGVSGAVVLVLFSIGSLSWDRGVRVHSRQILLEGSGWVSSTEASVPPTRVPFLGWAEASPWGMDAWKEQTLDSHTLIRIDEPARFSGVTFGPGPVQTSPDRVRWTGSLVWYRGTSRLEAAPAEYSSDLAWITRVAARRPARDWSVGLTTAQGGSLCWMAAPGGRQ